MSARTCPERGRISGVLAALRWERRVMSKDSEYLQQAIFCRDMAKRAQSADRKAIWLDLAGKWLSLGMPAAGNDWVDTLITGIATQGSGPISQPENKS